MKIEDTKDSLNTWFDRFDETWVKTMALLEQAGESNDVKLEAASLITPFIVESRTKVKIVEDMLDNDLLARMDTTIKNIKLYQEKSGAVKVEEVKEDETLNLKENFTERFIEVINKYCNNKPVYKQTWFAYGIGIIGCCVCFLAGVVYGSE